MFILMFDSALSCRFRMVITCMIVQSILDRGKILVHNMIQKVGFIGILLCASVCQLFITFYTDVKYRFQTVFYDFCDCRLVSSVLTINII